MDQKKSMSFPRKVWRLLVGIKDALDQQYDKAEKLAEAA